MQTMQTMQTVGRRPSRTLVLLHVVVVAVVLARERHGRAAGRVGPTAAETLPPATAEDIFYSFYGSRSYSKCCSGSHSPERARSVVAWPVTNVRYGRFRCLQKAGRTDACCHQQISLVIRKVKRTSVSFRMRFRETTENSPCCSRKAGSLASSVSLAVVRAGSPHWLLCATGCVRYSFSPRTNP